MKKWEGDNTEKWDATMLESRSHLLLLSEILILRSGSATKEAEAKLLVALPHLYQKVYR